MPRRNDVRGLDTPPNAMVASAQNITRSTAIRPPRSQNSKWQEQLWDCYDNVGEFEYVANWVGNLLSKARLYCAKSGKEVKNGVGADAVNELFGEDKSSVLRSLGIHATVAGESYIVTYKETYTTEWEVYAPQEVARSSGKWALDGEPFPTTELMVLRTWDRHPRRSKEAISPARAALPILNEIWALTQHVEAQVKSRLASAGILLLPNELTFAAASDNAGGTATNASNADVVVDQLIKVMSAAINNRDDASALVPVVVTGDGDYLDKARLLEFWSGLDEKALEMRDSAIRRLGLALDVPPEILTGTGDVSHWQAWGVDEASIKAHTEPLLKRVTGDLTRGYLWPALKGLVPEEDLHRYTIEADTSEMRLRPNRSQEAIELWDRGMLSDAALRRETGFNSDDEPSKTERRAWLLRKVAMGALEPSMAAVALNELGIQVTVEEDRAQDPQGPEPAPVVDIDTRRPNPTDAEKQDMMDDAERKSAALVAAAEQMVFRALERGGNRAMNRLRFRQEGVEAPDVYLFRDTSDAEASFMLDGAFEHCDRFASTYGVTPTWLAGTLEEYTRDLIVSKVPHTRARLEARLGQGSAIHA